MNTCSGRKTSQVNEYSLWNSDRLEQTAALVQVEIDCSVLIALLWLYSVGSCLI